MDNKQAYKLLMDIQSDWEDGEEYESFNIALQAIEKEIPDRPYWLQYNINPKIGNWNHGIACICEYNSPYCSYCGKKLDWRGLKDE